MEVIVLGLLCDLMGALGLLKADEAFESVKGGIVEEFVEEFIEGVLGIRLFINKRKTYVKVLAKKAAEYLGNLSEVEIATLREFFRTHKAQIKTKKGKIKQVAVEFEVPAKEQEKGEVKATLKKLAKELKKLYAQEKRSQEATIHYVTAEEALESLFVLQENEKYPETLKGFIAIVITHVHEVSYLALSEDDRDLAKVFQYMLDENTEALKRWFGKEVVTPDGFSSMKGDLAELKETLLLIMQQHESGALASAATVGKARKDPFCFAKLVCPDCHATGEYIVRRGNRTYCKKCGSAHDITENIEDLKKLLEETKQELAEKLDLQGRGVSEIGEKVDVIAQKMVTTEFFEQVFAEMKRENADSAEKTVEEIMLTKAE
ncbi:MAG: hypothetical protein IKZ28_04200, partial [Clostridia bacterium]|nr:hypothetical protein [Clostridia bacterium]